MNATLRMLGLTPERVKAMLEASPAPPAPPAPKKPRGCGGAIPRTAEEQARAVALFKAGGTFRSVRAATGISHELLAKIKRGAGL